MKRVLVLVSAILLIAATVASAQVKWTAPLHQYPSQWSSSSPPPPFYEPSQAPSSRVNPRPVPGYAQSDAYGEAPMESQSEKRSWFGFLRPRPGFAGNPFLHPPVLP